ncbi:Inositol phosphorylceramide synthase regulatory subunit kei1 [Erysiphe necator]|uniref:Inositol phoshorylceramide synthase regulatory subunit kei1 n=1 Tax=Uncinula necator TaxID=52586 RepID=A0A0B1P695_UNCNE|nr:Inositol phosphorylceramide synthase regulatory subunit kei1 [Erysiphe necator]KHJ32466.1 hypothetical protein EV44_g2448 [Erysiphe necator]
MGLLSRHLRIPRPTRFLGVMSLSTGVEMISIFMIFNKLTGFYGLLAILTGLRLSSLQITMYIYSCLAIVILAYLIPHIRKQSPFQCLLLSYFYLIDTVINTLFTCAFAIDWFLTITNGRSNSPTVAASNNMAKATTFKDHMYNISDIENVAKPTQSVTLVNEAIVYSVVSATATATPGSRFDETVPSVLLVVALTMTRVYFSLIVLAYVRQVLRRHAFLTSTPKLHLHTDGCIDNVPGDNLLTLGNPEKLGWKAKLGQLMIMMGEDYWIGDAKTDEAWAKGLDNRFRTSKMASEPPGTVERERRARSGTGPPMPLIKP